MIAGTASPVIEQLGELAEAGVQTVMLQWLDLDDLAGLEAFVRLDAEAMDLSAAVLRGTHDFRCFQTAGADRLRDFLGPDAGAFIDQQMKLSIPLGGKLGDPADDLGPVLVFLASDGAGFITGQLIPVDGGLAMVGG